MPYRFLFQWETIKGINIDARHQSLLPVGTPGLPCATSAKSVKHRIHAPAGCELPGCVVSSFSYYQKWRRSWSKGTPEIRFKKLDGLAMLPSRKLDQESKKSDFYQTLLLYTINQTKSGSELAIFLGQNQTPIGACEERCTWIWTGVYLSWNCTRCTLQTSSLEPSLRGGGELVCKVHQVQ